MNEIFDVVENKSILLPNGEIKRICRELSIESTAVYALIKKKRQSILSRYIHPDDKNNIFTFIDFETKKEYNCIHPTTLEHYFSMVLTKQESKYAYLLKNKKRQSISIIGRLFTLKGADKVKNFRPVKNEPESYKQKRMIQSLQERLAKNLRTRIWWALKAKKRNKTKELIGCSIEFLMGYLASKFTAKMSWDNYGQWHIDHIKPCSSFDLTIFKQQKICFNYKNLQPLWAFDNLSKGNKLN